MIFYKIYQISRSTFISDSFLIFVNSFPCSINKIFRLNPDVMRERLRLISRSLQIHSSRWKRNVLTSVSYNIIALDQTFEQKSVFWWLCSGGPLYYTSVVILREGLAVHLPIGISILGLAGRLCVLYIWVLLKKLLVSKDLFIKKHYQNIGKDHLPSNWFQVKTVLVAAQLILFFLLFR